MDDHHREILRKNRVYFIKNLKMVDLIDHVTDIVTLDHEEEITNKPTNREQVVCFLSILERRGEDAFTNFLVALENAECNFVKEHLEKQDQRRKQDSTDGYDEVDCGPVQETHNAGGRTTVGGDTAEKDDTPELGDWLFFEMSPKQRQQVISERAMAFVAREVGDLKDIGKTMGFSESKLQQFQGSCPFSVKSQVSSMFSEWRSKMGTRATVGEFVRLVLEAGINEQHVKKVIMKEYPCDDTNA